MYRYLEDDVEQIRNHAAERASMGRMASVVLLEDSGFVLAGKNQRVSAAAVLIALNRGYILRVQPNCYFTAFATSKTVGGGILVDALPKAA